MIMRYHWGLAVGHAYTHPQGRDDDVELQDRQSLQNEAIATVTGEHEVDEADVVISDIEDSHEPNTFAAEYSLKPRDDLDWSADSDPESLGRRFDEDEDYRTDSDDELDSQET
jgi:hypothetical protein